MGRSRLKSAAAWMLGLCLLAGAGPAAANGGLRVVLRYDDFAATSPTALERELLTGLAARGAPVLVAVLPFPGQPYPPLAERKPPPLALGVEKMALLRSLQDAGRVETALHGYSHHSNYTVDGKPSEFAGLAFERQEQLLSLGRAALEAALGVPVRTFTPPFNNFDATTVRALKATGFGVLSAGATPAEGARSLHLLPGSLYPQSLRTAVDAALRAGGRGLMVVVMHPYDFLGSGAQMPAFRKNNRRQMAVEALLEDVTWVKAQPGVRLLSLSEAQAAGEDLSAARVEANVRLRGALNTWGRLLPPSWLPSPPDGLVLETAEASRRLWTLWMRSGALVLSLLTVAFLIARWTSRSALCRPTRRLQRGLLAFLVVVTLVLGLRDGFYFLKIAALLLAAGWLLGLRDRPPAAGSAVDRTPASPLSNPRSGAQMGG